MISPEFEALAGQFHHVVFYKVDVDAHPEIAARAGVTAVSVPSIKSVVVLLTPGLDAHFHCPQERRGNKTTRWCQQTRPAGSFLFLRHRRGM
jgi:hypothetical protein